MERENNYSKYNEGHDDEDNQDEPQPELGGLVGGGTCIDTAESYSDHTDNLQVQLSVFSHLNTVHSPRSGQLRDCLIIYLSSSHPPTHKKTEVSFYGNLEANRIWNGGL